MSGGQQPRGKKIGKYQLGETLGEGNYGKVKKAQHVDTGAIYAVKIIDKKRLKEESLEEQMKREITVQKMLQHPNVVRLFEVMQTDNNIYLVLEIISGGELFDKIISAQRFKEDTARRYFQELIVGLHYCHQQGVAHRDLKPENLLLDDKDHIKITDFGLSNFQKQDGGAQGDGNMLNTVCGTPNYVAPEVLKTDETGTGYNGFTADVWTCGVILYVMVAGYLPFDTQDGNLNKLFQLIQRGEYRMPRGLKGAEEFGGKFSDELTDLCKKILVVDPLKRLTLEGIIKHPWFRKGFDESSVAAFRGVSPVNPTDEQVKNWATNAQESGQKAPKKGPGAALNAFQIIGILTGNTMTALTTQDYALNDGEALRGAHRSAPYCMVTLGAEEAQAKVAELMKQLGAQPQPTKQNPMIIKALITKGGALQFCVEILATVNKKVTLLKVRKMKGETLKFHSTYTEFLTLMKQWLVPPAVAVGEGAGC